jgi:hypothetical protein
MVGTQQGELFFGCCLLQCATANKLFANSGSQDPPKKRKVEPSEGYATSGSLAAASITQCSFCHWSPCFMDRDENYESMIVLGSELDTQRRTFSSIRLSLISEMSRKFHGRPTLPYCIIREIRDAYPPDRHAIVVKGNKTN